MAQALDVPVLGLMRHNWGLTGDPGSGWVLADGRSYPRTGALGGNPTGYDDLFATLCPVLGSPSVVAGTLSTMNLAAHDLAVGEPVVLTNVTTTGLATDPSTYYVRTTPTAGTFTLTATAPAQGQTIAQFQAASADVAAVAAGTFTMRSVPYGINDPGGTPSAVYFQLPDTRGRVPIGRDRMGRGAAGRLVASLSGPGAYHTGEERHLLAGAETGDPGHSHGGATVGGANSGTNPAATSGSAGGTSGNSGVGGSHVHSGQGITDGGDSSYHTHSVSFTDAANMGVSNSPNFYEPVNTGTYFQGLQGLSANHQHWAGQNSSGPSNDHAHTIRAGSMGGATVSGSFGPLSIPAEGATVATVAHRNMPPFLAANQIIRVS